MATKYSHRRYYRIRNNSGDLLTFMNTEDANSKINFRLGWETCAPKVTDNLEQNNQVLCKTFTFATHEDQVKFKQVVDELWHTGNPWLGSDAGKVEYMKVEWLHQDGSLSRKTEFISSS